MDEITAPLEFSVPKKEVGVEVRRNIKNLEVVQSETESIIVESLLQDSELSQTRISDLKKRSQQIRELKNLVVSDFDRAVETEVDVEALALEERVAAKRLFALGQRSEKSISSNLLYQESQRRVYFIGDDSALLSEALSVLPQNGSNVVGFELNEDNPKKKEITIYSTGDKGKLVKSTQVYDDQEALEKNISDTAMVVSVEGDIAGHAKRALGVAKELAEIGYGGQTYWIASGKYADLPKEYKGRIRHVQVSDEKEVSENERLISRLSGKDGLQLWNEKEVQEKAAQYRHAISEVIDEVGDKPVTVVSDFAPINDIVWEELAAELKRTDDNFMSETHNVGVPPERTIRVFKALKLNLGEIANKAYQTRIMQKIDPEKKAYKYLNGMINEVMDRYLGTPLYLYRKQRGIQKGKNPSFREEMLGRDGYITFGLDKVGENNVGLLAENSTNSPDNEQLNSMLGRVKSKKTIYHNEGSTYDRRAFLRVCEITSQMQDVYTINATGGVAPTREMESNNIVPGTIEANYEVTGYAPGYDIVRHGDVELAINQGGWGTISQAIGATTDKLQDSTRFILSELNQIDPDLERVNDVIRNNGGPVRWISIPQTWEQENNARIIEEEGGWCRVFIPSDLESEKGREGFKNAIDLALNQPLTPAELAFWKRLYGNSTKSAPALHTALILERKSMEKQKRSSLFAKNN